MRQPQDLIFYGNCEEAVEFYEKAIGTKAHSYDGFLSPSDKGSSLIYQFKIDYDTIRCFNAGPNRKRMFGINNSLSIYIKEISRLRLLRDALIKDSKEPHPLGSFIPLLPTIYYIADKFGVIWDLQIIR